MYTTAPPYLPTSELTQQQQSLGQHSASRGVTQRAAHLQPPDWRHAARSQGHWGDTQAPCCCHGCSAGTGEVEGAQLRSGPCTEQAYPRQASLLPL